MSWFVYQNCWRNAVDPRLQPEHRNLAIRSATRVLARRWWLWPFHVLVISLTANITWTTIPELQQLTIVTTTLLTCGAVFRFGAADLGNFFFIDRLLAIGLNVGVYFHPAFLYPSIMVTCCLQYSVSGWRLGPGYSNLLGFEFVRGSASAILACIAVCGGVAFFRQSVASMVSLLPWVVVGIQASYYVNHGLAKAFLGRHPFSWIVKNRIECLVVNGYLRGWRKLLGEQGTLQLASIIRRLRIPLCAGVLVLEIGFAFIFFDRYLAVALLTGAVVFHVAVFVLTGLVELEYMINHLNLGWLLLGSTTMFPTEQYGAQLVLVSGCCMLLAFAIVGSIRTAMLRERRKSGQSTRMIWADPFDHLMAWWDTPYMRMYSYVVTTHDGQRKWLPVPKLSPYDTALTDIHTHIMILNAHDGFDPQADRDKALARTGVWGLVIEESERDRLYSLMDADNPDFSEFASLPNEKVWQISSPEDVQNVAIPLWRLLNGINEHLNHAWFRWIMRYPHFPGEDLAKDICPLAKGVDSIYQFESPIASVTIQRIKTFYTGDAVELIEQVDVGRIELESSFSKAHGSDA